MKRASAASLLAIATLMTGCSSASDINDDKSSSAMRTDVGTGVEEPVLDSGVSGRLRVNDRAHEPGGILRLYWPNEQRRGIAYSLDRWEGTSWEPAYFLSSASQGSARSLGPRWWSVGDVGALHDVGLGGAGPDIALVPDTARHGTYRLCTTNSRPESCALVKVA